jgi:hypothetical protein
VEATPPYNVVAIQRGTLSTSGLASFTFLATYASSSFYLVINNRNCIETWSKTPMLILTGNNNFYDFTSPVPSNNATGRVRQNSVGTIVPGGNAVPLDTN